MCNEELALSQRHQVDDGSRFNSKIKLQKYLRPLIKRVSPTSEDHIISRAVSCKKKLLMQAKESLAIEGVKPHDGDIKMFLKDDKYPCVEEVAKSLGMDFSFDYSAPRCIQYRNKRYCLRLATYLHPIEEKVYQHCDWTGSRIFSKSRNLKQRAEDLRIKWDSFVNPKAILLDHSKFDAHCGVQLLNLEHWFYKKCVDTEELSYLLSMQVDNNGRTKNGTTYKTKATRMSGDQNTGLGNSIINYALLASFVEKFDLKASIYVDGDDSVIIIEDEGKHYDLSFFEQFGMKTKGDSTIIFEHVEFCQTRPVECEFGWTMVRNPLRMLTRTPWTVKQLSPKRKVDYMASIGRCELALGMGAPIGQYIGAKLAQLSNKHVVTDLEWVAKQQFLRPRRAMLLTPTLRARESYALAWGISPHDQCEIEKAEISLDVEVPFFEERPFVQ